MRDNPDSNIPAGASAGGRPASGSLKPLWLRSQRDSASPAGLAVLTIMHRILGRSGRGHVALSSHIGNTEMLRGLNSFLDNTPVNIIMETGNSRKFMAFLKSVNPAAGLRLIPADSINPATIIMLKEAVDRGEWVALLADRLPPENSRSITVPFLGGEACFPEGPWILAALLEAPACLLHCISPRGEPELRLRELGVIKISRGIRREDLRRAVSGYARHLEELLLESPPDWFNFFDFWQERQ